MGRLLSDHIWPTNRSDGKDALRRARTNHGAVSETPAASTYFPQRVVHESTTRQSLWQDLVSTSRSQDTCVRPQFVHAGLERTLIHKEDIKSICRVVRDTAERYVGQLESGESQHAVRCDLSSIKHHDRFIAPGPEIRQLEYCSGRSRRTAAVQVTLEPVLSFRQARGGFESELVGNDVRTTVVGWIQESLDREGLGSMARGRVAARALTSHLSNWARLLPCSFSSTI